MTAQSCSKRQGGRYIDEASGQTVSLGTFRAVLPNLKPGAVRRANLSVLTSLAAELAEKATGGISATTSQAANDNVAALFGGSFSPLETRNINLKSPGSPSSAVADHSLTNAAFSQLAADLALTLDQLLDRLLRDARDGKLDGLDDQGAFPFQDGGVVGAIARALAKFQQSSGNPGNLPLTGTTLQTLAGSSGDLARNTLPGLDRVPPSIIGLTPASLSTVPTNARIQLRFSEDLDPASVTNATLVLRQGSTRVAGVASYDAPSRSATFTPTQPLPASSTFLFQATTGLRDLTGNALAAARSLNFSTSATPTTPPPVLVSASPAGGATLDPDSGFSLVFDRALDPSSIFESGRVQLTVAGQNVAARIGASPGSPVVTISPVLPLAPGQVVILTINSGLSDVLGNLLPTGFRLSAGSAAMGSQDTTAPQVVAVEPASGANGVDSGVVIRVRLSEAVKSSSALNSLRLLDGATPVPATVTYEASARSLRLRPASSLGTGRRYTVELATSLQDPASNALAQTFRSEFTTAPAPLRVLTTSLPTGLVAENYSQTLASSGGTPPVAFALDSGTTLPAGLSLNPTGVIRGLTSAAGSTSFTVLATDSQGALAAQELTLDVASQPAGPVIDFVLAQSATVNEQTGNFTPMLRLLSSQALSANASVTVKLGSVGTASSGVDFSFTTQVVTFASGAVNGATMPVSLGVLGDNLFEGGETLSLTLSAPSGAAVGPNASHVVTITDDDGAPTGSSPPQARTRQKRQAASA